MEKREEERISTLLDEIPELKSLYAEHILLKRRLETLNHKHHPTSGGNAERKRLQKLKLAGKDRMMAILSSHYSSKIAATSG